MGIDLCFSTWVPWDTVSSRYCARKMDFSKQKGWENQSTSFFLKISNKSSENPVVRKLISKFTRSKFTRLFSLPNTCCHLQIPFSVGHTLRGTELCSGSFLSSSGKCSRSISKKAGGQKKESFLPVVYNLLWSSGLWREMPSTVYLLTRVLSMTQWFWLWSHDAGSATDSQKVLVNGADLYFVPQRIVD